MDRSAARMYAWILWPLAGLFAIRIIAQPLALVIDAPYLPPFDAWHSGVVPYGLLVASQVVIMTVLSRLAWRMARGAVRPRRRVGRVVLAAGGGYFTVMVVRLALGATLLHDFSWFARPLPTIFHLVLAGFILVYGHFHVRYASHA